MNKLNKLVNKEELLNLPFAKDYVAEYVEDGCTQDEAEGFLYNLLKGEGAIFTRKVGEVEVPKAEWSEGDWEHFELNGSVPTLPIIEEYFKEPEIN